VCVCVFCFYCGIYSVCFCLDTTTCMHSNRVCMAFLPLWYGLANCLVNLCIQVHFHKSSRCSSGNRSLNFIVSHTLPVIEQVQASFLAFVRTCLLCSGQHFTLCYFVFFLKHFWTFNFFVRPIFICVNRRSVSL